MGLLRGQTPRNFEGTDSDGKKATKVSRPAGQRVCGPQTPGPDRLGLEPRRPCVSSKGLDLDPGGRRAIVGSRTGWGDAGWEPRPCCGASPTHPLLPVTVLKVIDGAVVPVQPDAHQVARQETIFCQDHKVGEEASESLDHS